MTTEKKNISNQSGYTLIEVLVALAIFSIGLLGIASMQIHSLNGTGAASEGTNEMTWAADRMEQLLSLPFTDSDLSQTAGFVEADSADPINGSGYQVAWRIRDDVSINNTKTIDIVVWKSTKSMANGYQLTCVKSKMKE
jgi:type IV pilus modification protein PilV